MLKFLHCVFFLLEAWKFVSIQIRLVCGVDVIDDHDGNSEVFAGQKFLGQGSGQLQQQNDIQVFADSEQSRENSLQASGEKFYPQQQQQQHKPRILQTLAQKRKIKATNAQPIQYYPISADKQSVYDGTKYEPLTDMNALTFDVSIQFQLIDSFFVSLFLKDQPTTTAADIKTAYDSYFDKTAQLLTLTEEQRLDILQNRLQYFVEALCRGLGVKSLHSGGSMGLSGRNAQLSIYQFKIWEKQNVTVEASRNVTESLPRSCLDYKSIVVYERALRRMLKPVSTELQQEGTKRRRRRRSAPNEAQKQKHHLPKQRSLQSAVKPLIPIEVKFQIQLLEQPNEGVLADSLKEIQQEIAALSQNQTFYDAMGGVVLNPPGLTDYFVEALSAGTNDLELIVNANLFTEFSQGIDPQQSFKSIGASDAITSGEILASGSGSGDIIIPTTASPYFRPGASAFITDMKIEYLTPVTIPVFTGMVPNPSNLGTGTVINVKKVEPAIKVSQEGDALSAEAGWDFFEDRVKGVIIGFATLLCVIILLLCFCLRPEEKHKKPGKQLNPNLIYDPEFSRNWAQFLKDEEAEMARRRSGISIISSAHSSSLGLGGMHFVKKSAGFWENLNGVNVTIPVPACFYEGGECEFFYSFLERPCEVIKKCLNVHGGEKGEKKSMKDKKAEEDVLEEEKKVEDLDIKKLLDLIPLDSAEHEENKLQKIFTCKADMGWLCGRFVTGFDRYTAGLMDVAPALIPVSKKGTSVGTAADDRKTVIAGDTTMGSGAGRATQAGSLGTSVNADGTITAADTSKSSVVLNVNVNRPIKLKVKIGNALKVRIPDQEFTNVRFDEVRIPLRKGEKCDFRYLIDIDFPFFEYLQKSLDKEQRRRQQLKYSAWMSNLYISDVKPYYNDDSDIQTALVQVPCPEMYRYTVRSGPSNAKDLDFDIVFKNVKSEQVRRCIQQGDVCIVYFNKAWSVVEVLENFTKCKALTFDDFHKQEIVKKFMRRKKQREDDEYLQDVAKAGIEKIEKAGKRFAKAIGQYDDQVEVKAYLRKRDFQGLRTEEDKKGENQFAKGQEIEAAAERERQSILIQPKLKLNLDLRCLDIEYEEKMEAKAVNIGPVGPGEKKGGSKDGGGKAVSGGSKTEALAEMLSGEVLNPEKLIPIEKGLVLTFFKILDENLYSADPVESYYQKMNHLRDSFYYLPGVCDTLGYSAMMAMSSPRNETLLQLATTKSATDAGGIKNSTSLAVAKPKVNGVNGFKEKLTGTGSPSKRVTLFDDLGEDEKLEQEKRLDQSSTGGGTNHPVAALAGILKSNQNSSGSAELDSKEQNSNEKNKPDEKKNQSAGTKGGEKAQLGVQTSDNTLGQQASTIDKTADSPNSPPAVGKARTTRFNLQPDTSTMPKFGSSSRITTPGSPSSRKRNLKTSMPARHDKAEELTVKKFDKKPEDHPNFSPRSVVAGKRPNGFTKLLRELFAPNTSVYRYYADLLDQVNIFDEAADINGEENLMIGADDDFQTTVRKHQSFVAKFASGSGTSGLGTAGTQVATVTPAAGHTINNADNNNINMNTTGSMVAPKSLSQFKTFEMSETLGPAYKVRFLEYTWNTKGTLATVKPTVTTTGKNQTTKKDGSSKTGVSTAENHQQKQQQNKSSPTAVGTTTTGSPLSGMVSPTLSSPRVNIPPGGIGNNIQKILPGTMILPLEICDMAWMKMQSRGESLQKLRNAAEKSGTGDLVNPKEKQGEPKEQQTAQTKGGLARGGFVQQNPQVLRDNYLHGVACNVFLNFGVKHRMYRWARRSRKKLAGELGNSKKSDVVLPNVSRSLGIDAVEIEVAR